MRWYQKVAVSAGLASLLGTACVTKTDNLEHLLKERATKVSYDSGNTAKKLDEYREKIAIRPVHHFAAKDIKVTIYATERTKKLFESKPEAFSLLIRNVEHETRDALEHYRSYCIPVVKDLHLILRKAKYAEAKKDSSIIELDAWWFYTLFKNHHEDYAEAVLAHEHLHVENYVYDKDEYKRDKEFNAILAEAADLIKNSSVKAYLDEHSRFFGYTYDSGITAKDMPTQKYRRAVARYLVSALERKVYTSPYSARESLEKLTAAYLTEPGNSDAGFNTAAKLISIKKGKSFLTMAMLKMDAEGFEEGIVKGLFTDGFFD